MAQHSMPEASGERPEWNRHPQATVSRAESRDVAAALFLNQGGTR
jgi:hypothetical protein